MSTSQKVSDGQQPSAFNALGSYADRIKDANGNITAKAVATNSPSPAASSSLIPNGITSKISSPAPSATPSSSSSTTKAREYKVTSAPKVVEKVSAGQDEVWETVKSNRQKPRQHEEKEKHGSNSKNWRDRSHREPPKAKTTEETDKKGGHGKSSKKHGGSHSNTTPAKSTATTDTAKPPITTTVPSKPAWGALTHSTKPAIIASESNNKSTDVSTENENNQSTQTVPSSPSLNGTTVTANSVSIPPSVGSPIQSSETASTSTASASVLSKAVDKLEEDGSWRSRPKQKVEEIAQPTPQPIQPKQAAPPPAVNAWDLRKKAMVPAPAPSANNASTTHPSQPKSATGSISKDAVLQSIPNGHAKVESVPKPKKKTAARATSSALPPPIHDATLWPDVNQAAEVAKATEDKKDKSKDKSNEDASVTEDNSAGPGTGKKPKWTPIPASELLAAVDQVAENNRRQNRAEANAKKRATASKAENEASGSGAKGAAKPKKGVPHPVEGKKARSARASSTSEVKPAPTENNEGATSAPAEGAASIEKVEEPAKTDKQAEVVNGETETHLTRQTSEQSKVGSPSKSNMQLSSPTKENSTQVRLGSGPLQSRPMTGSNTASIPQHSFNANNNNTNLPRAPRGRDQRGSFNGRGRGGGFRSNSAITHKQRQAGFGSPPLGGNSGLPVDGFSPNGNANGFQRGFNGMQFQSFYPVQGYGQTSAGPGIYDPMQAQYGAGAIYRPGLPPPPMPQTVVPNLDATRFYVLGQIEYYFSMQNLAMDFFLRQQMDSEGWIDISMIASFNRVKSLTPDVSIVKECMVLSSLLEVREESVRLAGQDGSRWVLPDAKTSKSPASEQTLKSPSQATDQSQDLPSGLMNNIEHPFNNDDLIQQQRPIGGATATDVENALMKSSSVIAPALAINGEIEEGKEESIVNKAVEIKEDKQEEKAEPKEEEVQA
ncbi:uncharacterized protein L201_001811 [Kwoniella dendrophila CBS 6074]|uniref:HTH La-type RNA-binding domain-containing protein n=1 Tax=Kwoniella dendrophila CBS 6074 TaxID=1295534 RepID=A0AAX4JPC6_9TREE